MLEGYGLLPRVVLWVWSAGARRLLISGVPGVEDFASSPLVPSSQRRSLGRSRRMCARILPFCAQQPFLHVEGKCPMLPHSNCTHNCESCVIYCYFAFNLTRHIPRRSKSYLGCSCWCAKSDVVFSFARVNVSLLTPMSVRDFPRMFLHFCVLF